MDDDVSIDEKRVYADRTGAVTLAVATGMGVARVAVSGEQVGEFGLATRTPATDVATAPPAFGPGVAVTTDADVHVGPLDALETTDFGPAVAVGATDDALLAADPDGRLARLDALDGDWDTIGILDAVVRAIDGDLVAATDGVHRATDTGLQAVGLSDVHDVAAGTRPHAATGSGLYHLGNGWMDVLDGDFRTVAVTADGGRVARGHAATPDAFFEYRDGEWSPCDVDGAVTDVAHGPRDYAVTRDGAFLLRRDDGWHPRALGLPEAVGLAVVRDK